MKKKIDDDDLVDTDTDQDTNKEELQGKYQREESKKDNLESNKSETDEKYQRENNELFKKYGNPKKEDDHDLVDTDTDREINNEQSEEIYRIEESKKKIQNQINPKLMKDTRENIKNYLKGLIAKT